MGGKARLGPRIAEAIEGLFDFKQYHEPFCGMYSVGAHITCKKRSGSDVYPALIALLNAVRDGWRGPDYMSEEEYLALRHDPNPSPEQGWAGFCLSFGGRYFNSYARQPASKPDKDWAAQANRGFDKLRPKIQGVRFSVKDYRMYAGDADLLYCDPPYYGTETYLRQKPFCHETFYKWCQARAKEGRTVIVSEGTKPKGSKLLMEFPSRCTVSSDPSKKVPFTEKLFVYS